MASAGSTPLARMRARLSRSRRTPSRRAFSDASDSTGASGTDAVASSSSGAACSSGAGGFSGSGVAASAFAGSGVARSAFVADAPASVSFTPRAMLESAAGVLFVRSRRGARKGFAFITGVLTGTSLLTTSSSTSLPTMETVPPSLRLRDGWRGGSSVSANAREGRETRDGVRRAGGNGDAHEPRAARARRLRRGPRQQLARQAAHGDRSCTSLWTRRRCGSVVSPLETDILRD